MTKSQPEPLTDPRTEPAMQADEATTLLGYLNYHRDTLRMKAAGLDQSQLARTTAASSLTIGGLVKHMALVEHSWFTERVRGGADIEPWASVDWNTNPDWEFDTAPQDTPDELLGLLDEAIRVADGHIADALAEGGMDQLSVRLRQGQQFTLRWVVVHMIEEYARHNGHADLIRESIDGVTGD